MLLYEKGCVPECWSRRLEQLMLYQEQACYTLMWATACHGQDCGELRMDDVWDRTDAQHACHTRFFLQAAAPQFVYPAGHHLVLAQLATKTCQGWRAPFIQLWPANDLEVCSLRAITTYSCTCLHPQAPAGSPTTQFFRPLWLDHTEFKDSARSSSSMAYHLRQHLQSAGIYNRDFPWLPAWNPATGAV